MARESSTVRTGPGGRSWTIGNGLVEREVRFEPGKGLTTAGWRSLVTGTDFMRHAKEPGAEFSFVADGQHFRGAGGNFDFLGAEVEEIEPRGKALHVRLQARAQKLQVRASYAVYDGHPVIRKWIEIRNLADAPITITHLVFEELNLSAAAPAEMQLSAFYAVQPRELFITGRVDDAAILERNAKTGEGVCLMNEARGWMKRTETHSWGGNFRLMFDTDLFPFERRIAPGETYASAKSSIAFFVDGHRSLDPRWVIPSYTAGVLHRGGSAYQPPWIYNTWVPFGRGINAGAVKELIPVAGRMGFDIFTIDDGWQAEYGENAVNLQAFPKGLDEIQSLAERHNMRMGLWVPLAAISAKTKVYREHPEWVCRDASGQPKFTGTASGMQAVMCMATPYREVAAQRISGLITRHHLKYVKIDLTTVFNAYGESPGCYAAGHDHQSWAESLGGIYEGMAEVTERVYRRHPDVLLDLTFDLWGQRHLIDYGLLASGDLDWMSNVDDTTPESAGPVQARLLLYQRSLAMPAEAMLIGNLLAESPPIEERFSTAIGSGPLLLGDLRKLSPAQQDWFGGKVRWFKRLRSRTAITEGFFPLGSWLQPGAAAWDGFARLSRNGEGLIAIFRNQSGVRKVLVQIPAFCDGEFRLNATMTDMPAVKATGRELRSGIELALPAEHPVEVFEISRAH